MFNIKSFYITPQLSYDITPKFLRDTFKVVGEIVKVNLERDKEGKSKGTLPTLSMLPTYVYLVLVLLVKKV